MTEPREPSLRTPSAEPVDLDKLRRVMAEEPLAGTLEHVRGLGISDEDSHGLLSRTAFKLIRDSAGEQTGALEVTQRNGLSVLDFMAERFPNITEAEEAARLAKNIGIFFEDKELAKKLADIAGKHIERLAIHISTTDEWEPQELIKLVEGINTTTAIVEEIGLDDFHPTIRIDFSPALLKIANRQEEKIAEGSPALTYEEQLTLDKALIWTAEELADNGKIEKADKYRDLIKTDHYQHLNHERQTSRAITTALLEGYHEDAEELLREYKEQENRIPNLSTLWGTLASSLLESDKTDGWDETTAEQEKEEKIKSANKMVNSLDRAGFFENTAEVDDIVDIIQRDMGLVIGILCRDDIIKKLYKGIDREHPITQTTGDIAFGIGIAKDNKLGWKDFHPTNKTAFNHLRAYAALKEYAYPHFDSKSTKALDSLVFRRPNPEDIAL
jgi:hypothetical protein